MKLAAVYNVFDGEELLEKSILSIRDNVEVIVAVVQKVSNWGESYGAGWEECKRLKKMGLLDIVVQYEPVDDPLVSPAPWFMEHAKRSVGVVSAKKEQCTHVFHIDTDEYYKPEEFAKAKRFMIENPEYDSSVCRLKFFFKYPFWSIGLDEKAWVPFIHKLDDTTTSNMGESHKQLPVPVDPTRCFSPNNKVRVFEPHEVLMYHYSWVRKDITRKWKNSSARDLFESQGVVSDYDNAEVGKIVGYWNQKIQEDDNYFRIPAFNSSPQKTLLMKEECESASDVIKMYCVGSNEVAILTNTLSPLFDAVMEGLSFSVWHGRKVVALSYWMVVPRGLLREVVKECTSRGVAFDKRIHPGVNTLVVAGAVGGEAVDKVLREESDRVIHYILILDSSLVQPFVEAFLSSSSGGIWKKHQCLHDVTVLRRTIHKGFIV